MTIGLGLAWLIPLESILAASVDGAERWLPGQLLNAVARGGTASVSDAHALTLSAVVAAAAGAAALRFRREDITA